jgi:hypothetical protein
MSDQESMSEKELADYLAESVYSGQPRSVGEALAAADAATEPAEELPEAPDEPTPVAAPPVVVEDVPYDRDTEPDVLDAELPPEPVTEPEVEDIDEDTETDENVVWATKKYGDDPAKWAQAARHQEQHISRLASEKKEAEELASQWYEYAQAAEADAAQQQQVGMPLSAGEEQWVEQAMANPMQYAMQAAGSNNFPLYQAVIARVAEENPMLAANIGAQVQRAMEAQAYAEQNGGQQLPQPTLAESLGGSIQRLGIDLDTYGEPMSAKIGELGEYHPYVQTILEGEPGARDIALMAVYDLVRSTAMSTRKVRSEERENQIKHEAELRRQAAGVVTGGPRASEVPQKSGFMSAMEQEWRARGQWSDE